MGLRNRIMDRLGAEKEMDCWHYPSFTKGCWGSPGHRLCWLCKARFPVRLLKIMFRIRRT